MVALAPGMRARQVTNVLSAGPQAPGQARRMLAAALEEWDRSDLAERGALLMSEIVTNAFLHGAGDIRIVVSLGPVLRIEVHDSGPGMPTLRDYPPSAPTGRGLVLVEALADRWGTDVGSRGKTVWCELDAHADSLQVPVGD
jgi:anti-sigma regulatory factor (Ser/Thr protein kinase)